MKKLLALFIVLLVTVCMLISCGDEVEIVGNNNDNQEEPKETEIVRKKDEEKILGQWESELDFSKNISEIASGGDEEIAKYINVGVLKTAYIFDFDKEGNITISIDEEAFQKKLDTVREAITEGYTKYYQAFLEANGFDMTVDEYLEETGVAIEDHVIEALDPDTLFSKVEKLTTIGKYRLEDGKIFIDEKPIIYCFNSDTVLILMLDVSQMNEEASFFFPMTLEKK